LKQEVRRSDGFNHLLYCNGWPLTEQPNGLYFLKLQTADGVVVRKLVKE